VRYARFYIRRRPPGRPARTVGLALVALVALALGAGVHAVERAAVPPAAEPSDPGSAPVVSLRAQEPPAPAPDGPGPALAVSRDLVMDEYYVHVPPAASGRLEVLVALHGMGEDGRAFCQSILTRTDRERWVVVAPTFPYGDWTNPSQVATEESAGFIPRLHAFLATLPARTGLDLEPRVLLYGVSRGAQLAHRYALVYPEETQGVAMLSAGTYTLPLPQIEVDGRRVPLPYPFGTADLRERFGRAPDLTALQQVPFLVGVGGEDRNPAEVPHQWDPYIGATRVERAATFARRLAEIGVPVEFVVFPGVGHAVTDEMRARALDFVAALS
jgi:pimeloyl-ACP methyl ester carboxylesterase